MDLVRPWLAAFTVFLTASLGMAYVMSSATTPERLESVSGAIFWNAIPGFLIYLGMVVFGSIFHRDPHRDNLQRHLLAVFGVPVFAVLYSAVYALASGAVLGTAFSVFAGVIGAVVGWVATTRLRKRQDPAADGGGYL